MRGSRRHVTVLVCCLVAGPAAAAPVATISSLTNGLSSSDDGFVGIAIDEYGGYGKGLSASHADQYKPTGKNIGPITSVAGGLLSIRTGDLGSEQKSMVVLGDEPEWLNFVTDVSDGKQDGIVGNHTSLTRGVVNQTFVVTSATGDTATSTFFVEDTTIGFRIDVLVVQKLTFEPQTRVTTFDQTYALTNNSNDVLLPHDKIHLRLHLFWDADFGGSSDDIVGVRDICYVYLRDPASPDLSVSLGVAGIEFRNYESSYAGKQGQFFPTSPAFSSVGQVFDLGLGGMPNNWQDTVANNTTVGPLNVAPPFKTFVGDSGTSIGNGAIGLETAEINYFSPPPEENRFEFRRSYGTYIVPCKDSNKDCGNGIVDDATGPLGDLGETCDPGNGATMDVGDCNFETCQKNTCGDGYVNANLEDCESVAVDTDWCNGKGGQPAGNCKRVPLVGGVPKPCGDGYRNEFYAEPCDDGPMDSPTCNGPDAVKSDGSNQSIACTPAICGDHYTNNAAGEECDTGGIDTGECNGVPNMVGSCKRTKCGDGYLNALPVDQGGPGEECDDGDETANCNGPGAMAVDGVDVSCKRAMCGDGYANAANGEDCDGEELCDESCTFSFKLGGGCGGCASKNSEGEWILGFGVGAFVFRRRRYNSRRSK